jgi:serine/threonine-protein kinase HipA
MADRSLDVWLEGERVGRLDQEAGRLAFTYDPGWVSRPDAIPLSASLPVRAEPFDDRAARPFFAGLLPEQEKRDQVARALGVSSRNDFALLEGIGGECAGAVTFTHVGEKPIERATSVDYRLLDARELAAVLDRLPERPLLAGEEGIRLSLAGAQDKLPVLIVDGRVALPLHGVPSSHIIKPPIRWVEDSVHNEGFCLALAKAVGLDTAAAEIREVEGRQYLLVTRYDRIFGADNQVRRVHQEDFCQALGVAPEYKYQNEGGPSLVDCFALVRKVTRPAALFLPRLLDAVIFNALIGNHDAHAKNYSLLYSGGAVTLAPLYDLLSTAAYPELSSKMAMKIGGYYEFDDVLPRHWERFAKAAGLAAPQVRRRVLDMCERLPAAAAALRDDFKSRGLNRAVVDRIIVMIEWRCELTCRRFTAEKAAP